MWAESSMPQTSAPRFGVSGRRRTGLVAASVVFAGPPGVAERADRFQEHDQIGLLGRGQPERRQPRRAFFRVVAYHLGKRLPLAVVPIGRGEHQVSQRGYLEGSRFRLLDDTHRLERVVVVATGEVEAAGLRGLQSFRTSRVA